MKKTGKMKSGIYRKQSDLRGLPAALAVCVLLLLTACGRDDGTDGDHLSGKTDTTGAVEKQEWVYVPEVITVEDEHADYGRIQPVGEFFCYVSQEGDAENSAKSICRYSLAERELARVPICFPEGGANWDVGVWCFGEDCSVYLTANVYPADYSSMTRFLCKFDSEGNCLFFRDITERLGRGYGLEKMTVDGQGRLYLFTDEGEILLYTGEGEYHGSAGLPSSDSTVSVQVRGACGGADGKYYVCVSRERTDIAEEKENHCALMEMDFENARLSEVAGNLPDIKGFCAGKQVGGDFTGQEGDAAGEYDFLLYDERTLYGFRLAEQTKNPGEELLTWMDSDINGYCVANLYLLGDGRLCAAVEDWDNEDRAVVVLEKTKAQQAPSKEELILVTVGGESDLAAMAVKFNRGNGKYHLCVKSYESLTDLYNVILTGEPVDLVDLSGVNVQKLAEQGFFEDLSAYVSQSEAFGSSDFVDGILEVYTFDNTLVGIPASFTLRTVVGSRAQQVNQAGLTLEELFTASERHPGAQAFDGVTKEEMMQYLMMFNEDTFIDRETGTCHFDSETFRAVLEYVNQFPDSLENDGEEASLPAKIRNGEVLYAIAELNGLRAFQEYEGMFGEDAFCVGFPTPNGQGGHLLFTEDAYAIAAVSKHKEGAWKFIEELLSQEKSEAYYRSKGNPFSASFPSLKKTLREKVDEAMERDSQYESDKFPELLYSDGSSFQYHALTRDEVDVMLELVADAKPYFDAGSDEIIRIVSEEASGYYSGQKGIDAVAEVIQNRVQLYIDENML